MNENDTIKKGFNQGYLLQKHSPELAATIQRGLLDDKSPYSLAFNKGIERNVSDQNISKIRNYDKRSSKFRRLNKSKGIEKDMEKN